MREDRGGEPRAHLEDDPGQAGAGVRFRVARALAWTLDIEASLGGAAREPLASRSK